MQENYKLLFENKIGCVANLLHFNDAHREILRIASWISLNDMMLAQQKELTDEENHMAQWILVIKIGRNVQQMLNINNQYASNDLWREFEQIANGQERGNTTMHLIDYMVERCR